MLGKGNGVRVYQPLPAGCLDCKETGSDADEDAVTCTPSSVKDTSGHTITARSHQRHESYCRSQALLSIICRQPALRPHADQDVLGLAPTHLLDETIALLRAKIAVSQGTEITLHIDGLDGRDRSLDTDIPIRWALRLHAETASARLRQQAPFP